MHEHTDAHWQGWRNTAVPARQSRARVACGASGAWNTTPLFLVVAAQPTPPMQTAGCHFSIYETRMVSFSVKSVLYVRRTPPSSRATSVQARYWHAMRRPNLPRAQCASRTYQEPMARPRRRMREVRCLRATIKSTSPLSPLVEFSNARKPAGARCVDRKLSAGHAGAQRRYHLASSAIEQRRLGQYPDASIQEGQNDCRPTRRYAAGAPLFAPGTGWEYSPTAWIVVAAIVERVSGLPFG